MVDFDRGYLDTISKISEKVTANGKEIQIKKFFVRRKRIQKEKVDENAYKNERKGEIEVAEFLSIKGFINSKRKNNYRGDRDE